MVQPPPLMHVTFSLSLMWDARARFLYFGCKWLLLRARQGWQFLPYLAWAARAFFSMHCCPLCYVTLDLSSLSECVAELLQISYWKVPPLGIQACDIQLSSSSMHCRPLQSTLARVCVLFCFFLTPMPSVSSKLIFLHSSYKNKKNKWKPTKLI